MSDQAAIRELARAVVRELQNSGGVVDIHEAQHILAAENSNATEFECAVCHAGVADPTAKRCPKCGSGSMIIASDAAYRCARCGHPIRDRSIPSCPSCGHDKVVAASGAASGAKSNPAYSCADCLGPVTLEQARCSSCGSRKAWRNIEV